MNDQEKITAAQISENQANLKAKYELEIETARQATLKAKKELTDKDDEIFELQKQNKRLNEESKKAENEAKKGGELDNEQPHLRKPPTKSSPRTAYLESKDFKKLPAVFSCKLPIFMDEVFNTIFHKKKMKQALQSPAHQTALIDRLIDSMKTKAITALNRKLVEIISDKDNYKDSAWEEITAEEANIDNLDKAIVILKKIKAAYNAMDESKVLTIDPDFLDDLEIHFLADVARDSNLNPYKLFKEVIVKKLENNVLATIHDEKSVFYRIINPDEIQHEKTLGGGMEKFAYHVEVQDLVNLENSIDAQILAQEREKNENLQKALDSLVEVLGKEDIHTLTDLKALLQGQTLKNLLALNQQKHNDLEAQLLNLAKQKITKQKQATELLNHLESH
ncbi:3882_t:CDS:2 [Funneliformis geosporum]|uniref:3882_t:CDS:1 n=1 Tax=Funneliformis geosporum TaxID=1117311 RepID=A0A9W4WVU8_9GLOM|nr:3882_t:CDS:2 [Funneliformis geosporum]